MTKTMRTLIAALLLSLSAAGCGEQKPAGDLRAELAALRDRIAAAKETAELHQGGLIGEMAQMRHETLLLSAALLENRLIAQEGGVPARLVAPAAAPDPARAQQILQHIAAAEKQYEHARKQAATNASVAGGLARTTVVTQELALAQLWLAYYQSAYGVVAPGLAESKDAPPREVVAGSGAPAPAAPARIFEDLGTPGASAPAEDAESSSAAAPPAAKPAPAETAQREVARQEAAREPAAPSATQTVAQEGGQGEDAQNVTALIESVKQRAGPKQEPQPVTAPRPPQRRDYSREDTLRIQLLLQEAGFNPGAVDGRWGPSTQGALAEFQRARGLPASGRPDAATLGALGLY